MAKGIPKNMIRFFLLVSLLVNAILIFHYYSSKKQVQKPIWHPFELAINLSLESVVEDGFRIASMPCGQVQYTKTIADTTIQYEIDIDCNNTWYNKFLYPDIQSETFHYTPNEKNGKIYKGDIENNKYHPWDINKVRNCRHIANWSLYMVDLGHTIDSMKVVEFVEKNHAYIGSSSVWNSKEGGGFMAHSYETKLSYGCQVQYQNIDYPDSTYSWVLTVHRELPDLN